MNNGSVGGARYERLNGTSYDVKFLKKLTVLVVGVGAVGGEIVKHLALLGVGHIVIVDPDTFEPSNLNRSVLFASAPDLWQSARGLAKVHLAREVLRRWNDEIRVTSFFNRIEEVDFGPFLLADLVISCVDTLAARIFIAGQASRAGVPLVEGGISPNNLEMFELFASDTVAGPCSGMCHYQELRDFARANVLPEAFYFRQGCREQARTFNEVGSVPSTSMTASILASQEVILGLQRARDRRRRTVDSNGTHLKINVAPLGEQTLVYRTLPQCTDCPFELVKAMGGDARAARERIGALRTSARELTLEHVLYEAARIFEVDYSQVTIFVDQGFSDTYYCPRCNEPRSWNGIRLSPKARSSRCTHCESGDLIPTGELRQFSVELSQEMLDLACRTPLETAGYGRMPGWIAWTGVGDVARRAIIVAEPAETARSEGSS